MNIIELNNKIEEFVHKNDLSNDAYALKKEHAIAKSEEWQKVLDSLTNEGRVLRIGIIGRVKAGKSSMLNALLFNGNDILPKAATPMTAALTIMEYSDTVRAEVDFFTQTDIDEIKIKHDAYVLQFNQLKQQKEQEQKERFQKKKGLPLTPDEQKECQDKALSQAEREMKNSPNFAAYDQYNRIKKSGKSLIELEEFRTIRADNVSDLMNGELNKFVGADGAFMPFTKSVTLYIPENGLKGLQIIDTPGINDPVTSRGERTEQLLQECDVVLMVSPSGQFLSSEDTDLIHRVTTKEGTQEAYIIASQVDNQLFGSESHGLNNPIEVLSKISSSLTTHARNVLAKQTAQFPAMKVAAEKLSKNDVICSSSVAYSLMQHFDNQSIWDANLKHVWNNLKQKFPDTFSHSDLAKNALAQMANINRLHAIVEDVTANKGKILAERRINFENQKRQALHDYLAAWENRINEQVHQIQTADVGELRNQEQKLKNQQTKIDMQVGGVYEDLVSDIKLNLDKQLKDKLIGEMKRYDASAEGAQGTATESEEVYIGRGGFLWLTKKYKTVTYEVTTVQATSIRRAIEEIRHNLEDELRYIAENYSLTWKKKIYSNVIGALREAMGDDELDISIIARAVKNILARIPEVTFQLNDDMPSSLKRSGQLKGSEAEVYIQEADNYISELRQIIRNQINSYMTTLIQGISQINLPKELTGSLEDSLKQLLHEIENKEASLHRYQTICAELKALQQA